MIKAQKTMAMEAFVDRILPFTDWAPYDIQKWANESIAEGKPFILIIRDIEFTIPKESIIAYQEAHGLDKSFDSDEDSSGSAFLAAVEGKEIPVKRGPGRPRKAKEGDPLPEEFKT